MPGNPRKTKHRGLVSRPKVAESYLSSSASSDIHNHVRTGSLGLEDIWRTLEPQKRQFAGIFGFIFTNAYLAYKFFRKETELKHTDFKMSLSNALINYTHTVKEVILRSSFLDESAMISSSHQLVKLPYGKPCYSCRHGSKQPIRRLTTFECSYFKVPLCKPSIGRNCWVNHLSEGLPKKRRFQKGQSKRK